MALCTPDELSRRLALRKADFRWRGESVDPSTHPEFAPTLISWGSWLYQAAFDPETAETMIASPDLNGEDCHVFWHMATSAEDLLQNLKAAQLLAERSPLSGYASIGRDELQALMVATIDVDRAHGTDYHERVLDYVRRFQREQLMAAAAVTDVKGDRSKRPGRAGRPRHVPARRRAQRRRHRRPRREGAHVGLGRRGGADRDPDARDAPGGRGLRGRLRDPRRRARASRWSRAHSTPAATASGRRRSPSHDELAETFTVFNDVFVPHERVFLHGEWQHAGDVANLFASVNRQGYLGTESGASASSSAPRRASPSSTAPRASATSARRSRT